MYLVCRLKVLYTKVLVVGVNALKIECFNFADINLAEKGSSRSVWMIS